MINSTVTLFIEHTSSSSIGTTAHCGLWPVDQCPSIFSYLPSTLSTFSLPSLEDHFLLPLSNFSWVFAFFSSLPVLEWRSFWAYYPTPFSLGDLTSLSFALLSTLPYFLLCSSLLVLDFMEHTAMKVPGHQRVTYPTYALYLGYGVDVLPLFNLSHLVSIGSWAANDTAAIRKHHTPDAYKSPKFRSEFEMPKIVWPPRCVADEEDNSLHKQLLLWWHYSPG